MKNTLEVLKDLEKRLSNLEEKCINNKKHRIKRTEDGNEELCEICGGYRINCEWAEREYGLAHYLVSDRYKALIEESERMKNEMAKGKNI